MHSRNATSGTAILIPVKLVVASLTTLAFACGECDVAIGLHSETCITDADCERLQPKLGQRFRLVIVERYDQEVKTVQRPTGDRYPGKACPTALVFSAGDSIDVQVEGFGPRSDGGCGTALLELQGLNHGESTLEGAVPPEQWRFPLSGNAFGVARLKLSSGCAGKLAVRFHIDMADPERRSEVLDGAFVADDRALCGLEEQLDATCIDPYVHELIALD